MKAAAMEQRLLAASAKLGLVAEHLGAMGPELLDCPALLRDVAGLLAEVRADGAALDSPGARSAVSSLQQRMKTIEGLFESAAGFYSGASAATLVQVLCYGNEGASTASSARGLFHCEG